MDALNLCNQGHVNGASMDPMALSVSNEPVTFIVFAASFQRDIMTYIPFFARRHLHLAKVAHSPMTEEYVSPTFGSDADALDQWIGFSVSGASSSSSS